jgi:hypothetical protein
VIVRAVGSKYFDFRFLPRSATIRKISPEADQKLVKNFERQLAVAQEKGTAIGLIGHPSEPEFFSKALREFNGNLQLTEPRGLIVENVAAALEEAYQMYVAEPAAGARPISYQAIAPYQLRERVWSAFERSHLIRPGLLKKAYSVKGRHARWTFDLGYQNGSTRIISSVALNAPTGEINLGRALVFKGMIDDVKDEVEKVRGTAVVQLPKTRTAPGAKEAQEFLKDSRINVIPSSDLDELVNTVRKELGVEEESRLGMRRPSRVAAHTGRR